MYPAPEFPPRKPRLFARTPPAVFPVVLGLLGLGLALRQGLSALGLPGGMAEVLLGAAGAIWAFAMLAYGAKLGRRPGVLAEEMRVLPSRGGVAAGSVGAMALAAALAPFAPRIASALLLLALLGHAAQAVMLVAVLRRLPDPARRVNPSVHLSFVGPIVGALAAAGLGWTGLAVALFWATLPVALLIWTLSAVQFAREVPPAPLRPILAIHLAPASLLASVAAQTGQTEMAVAFALAGGAYLATMLLGARWMTVAGFSPLWGSFTFPLAAYSGALFAVGWDFAGTVVLIAALGVVPVIAYQVIRMWATGSLAQKTNAAEA